MIEALLALALRPVGYAVTCNGSKQVQIVTRYEGEQVFLVEDVTGFEDGITYETFYETKRHACSSIVDLSTHAVPGVNLVDVGWIRPVLEVRKI